MLTEGQQRNASRILAEFIYAGGTRKTATMDLDQLRAAIGAIDAVMDTTVSVIPLRYAAGSVKTMFMDQLPEPFKTEATAQEKALAMKLWADEESRL